MHLSMLKARALSPRSRVGHVSEKQREIAREQARLRFHGAAEMTTKHHSQSAAGEQPAVERRVVIGEEYPPGYTLVFFALLVKSASNVIDNFMNLYWRSYFQVFFSLFALPGRYSSCLVLF